jgi:16S rRNA (adenine1518-N6/adenine1519-N6)-dimethyltransferase
MASQVAHVVTVEIDQDLANVAQREFAGHSNITLVRGDALKNKNHLRQDVLDEVQHRLAERPGGYFKLVANLPYNVATPILSNLLRIPRVPDLMVVTIQKELAERITAVPRTKDYSALSIWMQSQCDCEIIRIMPPTVFWPRPKVDSAILRVRPQPEKRARIADMPFFHQCVRSIFLHRRKFLRSALVSAMKDRMDKSQVDQLLSEMKFGQDARAEQLTIDQMLSLVNACQQRS